MQIVTMMKRNRITNKQILLPLVIGALILAGCDGSAATTSTPDQTSTQGTSVTQPPPTPTEAAAAASTTAPSMPLGNDYAASLAEAEAALDAGQPERMEAILDSTPATRTTPSEILVERAALYEAGGFPEQAVQNLSYALIDQPDRVDLLLNRANLYRTLGYFELALTDLNVALSIEPDNLTLMMAHGTLRLDTGDAEAALRDLEPVRDSEDAPPEIFEALGRAYLMQEDYYNASLWLTQGIVEDVDSVPIRIMRGTALLFLDNTELALGDANIVISRNPESVEGYALRGTIYLNLGRWDEAERDFNRTYELDPTFIDALYGMAQAQIANGDTGTALASLKAYLELASPGDRNYTDVYTLYNQLSEDAD